MDVLIVLGSISDIEHGKKAVAILEDFGIAHRMVIASAHRTPERLGEIIKENDAKVFIAMAGMSAALPGAIASLTTRPVIGVPLSGKLNLDSILSVTQMPPGIPVAAVALDGAENAAILAAEILSLADEKLRTKLKGYRDRLVEGVVKDSLRLGG